MRRSQRQPHVEHRGMRLRVWGRREGAAGLGRHCLSSLAPQTAVTCHEGLCAHARTHSAAGVGAPSTRHTVPPRSPPGQGQAGLGMQGMRRVSCRGGGQHRPAQDARLQHEVACGSTSSPAGAAALGRPETSRHGPPSHSPEASPPLSSAGSGGGEVCPPSRTERSRGPGGPLPQPAP